MPAYSFPAISCRGPTIHLISIARFIYLFIRRIPPAGSPVKPIARFNYMSTDEDWRGFRAAIRITREIMAQPAFDGLCGDEIQPGYAAQTDAEASPPRAWSPPRGPRGGGREVGAARANACREATLPPPHAVRLHPLPCLPPPSGGRSTSFLSSTSSLPTTRAAPARWAQSRTLEANTCVLASQLVLGNAREATCSAGSDRIQRCCECTARHRLPALMLCNHVGLGPHRRRRR